MLKKLFSSFFILGFLSSCGYSTDKNDPTAVATVKEYGRFHNGTSIVHISGSKPAAELIPILYRLPETSTLSIHKANLTEAQLEMVGNLYHLRMLEIVSCEVNDDDLKYLNNLKSLRILTLTDQPIQGKGLKYLAQIPILRELNLRKTEISGPGLEGLASVPKLERLDLSETKINDEGLKYLLPIVGLKHLKIHKTNITTEEAIQLATLPNLQSLSLSTRMLYVTNTRAPESKYKDVRDFREKFKAAQLEAREKLQKSGPSSE